MRERESRRLSPRRNGRRFWPVVCGKIELDLLRRDRDQLWAEAVTRYNNGAKWWLDTPELTSAAAAEQDERFDDDPWDGPVNKYLMACSETSIAKLLQSVLKKDIEHWTQQDKNQLARILQREKWERFRKRMGSALEWRYREPKGIEKA